MPYRTAQRRSFVGWAVGAIPCGCPFCPPVGAGGQQKDVAHPTKKA